MEATTALAPNDLVRVGKGTPGGEWLRRYWLVVGTVPSCATCRARSACSAKTWCSSATAAGDRGCSAWSCPHRGTSLEYGDVEAARPSLPLSRWLFDIGGQCREQPGRAPGSTFYQRVRHLASSGARAGGAPLRLPRPTAEEPPPLPRYAALVRRARTAAGATRCGLDYNWFNFWENSADPCHISVLHRFERLRRAELGQPVLRLPRHARFRAGGEDYGLKIVMRNPARDRARSSWTR